MNPLQQIPANVRKWLYVLVGLGGLAVAILPIWGVEVDKIAQTLNVIVAFFGLTAASNVSNPEQTVVTSPPGSNATVEVSTPDEPVD